jgi:arsenate reductase
VYKALRDSGVDVTSVNYYTEPISKSKLKGLLKKMNSSARDLLRTTEPIYKKLNIGKQEYDEDELIEFMVQYPDLLQRPIVEKGERAILARPPERLKEIFSAK